MAAITLDEFVIKLGLDPADFNTEQQRVFDNFKKTQDQAKKTADQMEADGKVAARFYSQIKDQALETIAVLIGAKDVTAFIGKTVTDVSAVGRIAAVMGQATPDLIAISMAVERIGGNAQGAQQSLLGLSQALTRYRLFGEGSLEFRRSMSMIGVGPNATPLQVLQAFAAYASRQPNKQTVENVGQALGLNQDLINEAMRGRPQFDKDIAQSYALGIPTDADIKKVQDLQNAFIGLGQSVKFTGLELIVKVADPLTHLLNAITALIKAYPAASQALMGIVAALLAIKGVGLTVGVLRAIFGLAGVGGAGAATAAAGEAAAGGEAAGAAAAAGGLGAGAVVGGAIVGGVGAAFIPTPLGGNDTTGGAPTQGTRADVVAYAKAHGIDISTQAGFDAARIGYLADRRMHEAQVPQGGTGGGRVSKAMAALQSAGFTAAQARGIVAGLEAEDPGLDPDKKNPLSTARGIAQWTRSSGRQQLFAQVMGEQLQGSSFDDQLRFLIWELTHTQAGPAGLIRGAKGSSEAALAFLSRFEAPDFKGLIGDIGRAQRFLGPEATRITIDQITIYTQAKDAKGIARDLHRELAGAVAANANTGLN